MACNPCEGGQEVSAQHNLVAWIQPSGAGPNNPAYYAMAENGNYPAVRLEAYSFKRRGTTTPIFRRSGVNPRRQIRVGQTVAQPADNTVSVTFAEGQCGGYMPNELIRCKFALYQQHICCADGGEFESGWNRIDIVAGIDPESIDYSAGVDFDAANDNPLTMTHPGTFSEKLTIYPLAVNELTVAAGLTHAASIRDIIYLSNESCGDACGGNVGCQDAFYAVSDVGRVFYKKNALSTLTFNAIAAYPESIRARIAVLGSLIFVSYYDDDVVDSGGYYWAQLDSDGDPGAWTQVEISATFIPDRFLVVGNKLILAGFSGGNDARIYEIDKSAAFTTLLEAGDANNGVRDIIECGGRLIAVGIGGAILVSSCSGVWGSAGSTPTSDNIYSIAARTLNEWWIASGNTTAEVYYTVDSGANWIEKVLPFSGAANTRATQVVWANEHVGYITVVDLDDLTFAIWATFDGGNTWINTGVTNNRITTPPTGTYATRMVVPCCSNSIEQSNAFMIAGTLADDGLGAVAGGIWQASIQQCQ